MTALAAAGIITAGGLAELGNYALDALTIAALAVGSYVMLIVFLCLLAISVFRWRKRHEPLVLVVAPLPENATGPCPWCDTHECLDSTLCDCGAPCGSWLCVVKEASRG